jgi:hypothetical protein
MLGWQANVAAVLLLAPEVGFSYQTCILLRSWLWLLLVIAGGQRHAKASWRFAPRMHQHLRDRGTDHLNMHLERSEFKRKERSQPVCLVFGNMEW